MLSEADGDDTRPWPEKLIHGDKLGVAIDMGDIRVRPALERKFGKVFTEFAVVTNDTSRRTLEIIGQKRGDVTTVSLVSNISYVFCREHMVPPKRFVDAGMTFALTLQAEANISAARLSATPRVVEVVERSKHVREQMAGYYCPRPLVKIIDAGENASTPMPVSYDSLLSWYALVKGVVEKASDSISSNPNPIFGSW